MYRSIAPKFLTAYRVETLADSALATHRQRRRVAKAIDVLARPISRPQLMLGPPMVRRRVASAALPQLLAVRPLLTDPEVRLSIGVVDAMWRFLTDGMSSPLFEDFPDEARQHAYGLSQRLIRDSATRRRVRTT